MRNLGFLIALAQFFSAPCALAVDINGQLKKAQLEKLNADPTGTEARIYWNTSTLAPKVYNGTSWLNLGLDGGTTLFGSGTVSAPSIAFSADADGTGTGIYRIGANNLGFAANGVASAAISSAGAFSAAASLAVSGQTNTAASGAATTSTAMAHYSEGTWTPVITSSGGGTASYGVQVGRFTRIGRLVHASFRLNPSNLASLNAGNLSITGFPFTSANVTHNQGACVFKEIESVDYPAGALEMLGRINENTSTMLWFFSRDNTTPLTITKTEISTASAFGADCTYTM